MSRIAPVLVALLLLGATAPPPATDGSPPLIELLPAPWRLDPQGLQGPLDAVSWAELTLDPEGSPYDETRYVGVVRTWFRTRGPSLRALAVRAPDEPAAVELYTDLVIDEQIAPRFQMDDVPEDLRAYTDLVERPDLEPLRVRTVVFRNRTDIYLFLHETIDLDAGSDDLEAVIHRQLDALERLPPPPVAPRDEAPLAALERRAATLVAPLGDDVVTTLLVLTLFNATLFAGTVALAIVTLRARRRLRRPAPPIATPDWWAGAGSGPRGPEGIDAPR